MKKPHPNTPGAFGKCKQRNSHELTQERDAISNKLKAEDKKRKAKQ